MGWAITMRSNRPGCDRDELGAAHVWRAIRSWIRRLARA